MVVTRKNESGFVIAWGEFRIVNALGAECPEGGVKEQYDYAWINDAWVHEKFRSKEGFNMILKEFIKMKHDKLPWVNYIYWTRKKHGGRMSCYEIRRIVNESLSSVE